MITKTGRIALSLLCMIFAIGAALSQSFTVQAPQRVYKGEKFYVTYRLTNISGGEPRVPNINGCRLLYGPTVTNRSSYEISGNGQATSTSSTEFTYFFLAEQTGEFTIPAASISANGKTLQTRPQKLTITNAPAGALSQGGQRQQQEPDRRNNAPVSIDDISTQSADKAVSPNDVFVRIILSKPTAYEQEAIECTIKLYTKFGISQFFPTKQPSFDGFLIEEVNFQSSLNQVETYNGQRYMVALLKKCIIFPQKSGKLIINSGNYDINVVQYNNTNLGFLNLSTPKERKIQVTSNTASIDIKPLPSPQPAGFSGAVGEFNVTSKLVGNSFRTNDPATLIYTVTGAGNIKYVKEPSIDFPSEFELYQPKTNYDTRVNGSTVTGTMTTEYTFVPQSVGKFTIGTTPFVYFNPTKGEYVTVDTPSYPVNVAQGIEQTNKKDVEIKNKDILNIVTGDKNATFNHTPIIATFWYWLIYAALAGGLFAAVKIYGRRLARAADVKGMKLAKANKVVRKRLKLTQQYMQSDDSDKFYEELLRAVWGYLSDKLAIPSSELSRDNISAELEKFGASETDTQNVIKVLDECEMARYTPASSHQQLVDIFNLASDTIKNLENTAKRK